MDDVPRSQRSRLDHRRRRDQPERRPPVSRRPRRPAGPRPGRRPVERHFPQRRPNRRRRLLGRRGPRPARRPDNRHPERPVGRPIRCLDSSRRRIDRVRPRGKGGLRPRGGDGRQIRRLVGLGLHERRRDKQPDLRPHLRHAPGRLGQRPTLSFHGGRNPLTPSRSACR